MFLPARYERAAIWGNIMKSILCRLLNAVGSRPQMSRWKVTIGPKLRAANLDNRKTEAKPVIRVLTRMIELGRPEFKRVT